MYFYGITTKRRTGMYVQRKHVSIIKPTYEIVISLH